MLSCLRNSLRLSSRVPHIARFATSSPLSNDSRLNEGLFDIVIEEANKLDIPSDTTLRWKPIQRDTILTPHQFTYNARVIKEPTRTKRPAVAPPRAKARYNDPFYQLDIDPLTLSQYPHLLGSYMSDMGRIMPRSVSGLTSKSQRRLGKAIRRAKMMGVIPVLSNARTSQGRT